MQALHLVIRQVGAGRIVGIGEPDDLSFFGVTALRIASTSAVKFFSATSITFAPCCCADDRVDGEGVARADHFIARPQIGAADHQEDLVRSCAYDDAAGVEPVLPGDRRLQRAGAAIRIDFQLVRHLGIERPSPWVRRPAGSRSTPACSSDPCPASALRRAHRSSPSQAAAGVLACQSCWCESVRPQGRGRTPTMRSPSSPAFRASSIRRSSTETNSLIRISASDLARATTSALRSTSRGCVRPGGGRRGRSPACRRRPRIPCPIRPTTAILGVTEGDPGRLGQPATMARLRNLSLVEHRPPLAGAGMFGPRNAGKHALHLVMARSSASRTSTSGNEIRAEAEIAPGSLDRLGDVPAGDIDRLEPAGDHHVPAQRPPDAGDRRPAARRHRLPGGKAVAFRQLPGQADSQFPRAKPPEPVAIRATSRQMALRNGSLETSAEAWKLSAAIIRYLVNAPQRTPP